MGQVESGQSLSKTRPFHFLAQYPVHIQSMGINLCPFPTYICSPLFSKWVGPSQPPTYPLSILTSIPRLSNYWIFQWASNQPKYRKVHHNSIPTWNGLRSGPVWPGHVSPSSGLGENGPCAKIAIHMGLQSTPWFKILDCIGSLTQLSQNCYVSNLVQLKLFMQSQVKFVVPQLVRHTEGYLR